MNQDNGVEHTFPSNDRIVFRMRLVIEPRTGRTLAQEQRDQAGVVYSEAVVSLGLTDQARPSA